MRLQIPKYRGEKKQQALRALFLTDREKQVELTLNMLLLSTGIIIFDTS